MAANNPPPQAYTKETVTQAYEWLFAQPTSIREVASDLDTMVALFLQAKRRKSTPGVSTNPVSAKAFKDELKGLAENFKQFDPSEAPAAATAPHQFSVPMTSPAPQPSQPPIQAPRAGSSLTELDSKSLQQIRRVMESLNLSSESETLRLLISLGYEKVREILPKN